MIVHSVVSYIMFSLHKNVQKENFEWCKGMTISQLFLGEKREELFFF